MDRRKETFTYVRCEHYSPVLVGEARDGKVAHCLRCGQSGPVRQGAEEALHALRDQTTTRDRDLDRDPRSA